MSPLSDTASSPSLRARALRGSVWSIGGFAVARVLQLGSNLILTRLLVPEAFGLMALVNVIIMGLALVSDLGIIPGIVQSKRGDEPSFLNTAWTAQIARGFVLWGIACLVAGSVAAFYDQPELGLLLPVMAFASVFAGFESTSVAQFERHLRLGRLTAIEIPAQLVGIAVMVIWALNQKTVWALVFGSLAAAATRTVVSHWMNDRRDRVQWDASAARELLHFGKWILVSTLFAFLSTQLDRLIFGKMIPFSMLGVYSIAAMFSMMPGELLGRLGRTVVFPVFSRHLDDVDQLGSAYRRAKLPLLGLAGLAIGPLATAGSALIETLYTNPYADAGWILQVLALGAWFRALEVPPGAALLSLGRPNWIAAGHAAKVVGIAALIPIGFSVAGFPGAVAGLAASQLFLYATAVFGAHRYRLGGLPDDLLLTGILGIAIGCGVYVSSELAAMGIGSVVRLVVGGAVPASIWAAGVYAVLRRDPESLRGLLPGSRDQ